MFTPSMLTFGHLHSGIGWKWRSLAWPWAYIFRHAFTAYLFTKSDFKTILVPVTAFSAVLAPVQSTYSLLASIAWTWLHLLHFCMANQCSSVEEDALNKPWRPIPSGRISPMQTSITRWVSVPLCLAFSLRNGTIFPSLVLLVATWVYNDLGYHNHWLMKNVLNVAGYVAFELGATEISEQGKRINSGVAQALIVSGLVILTTVHAGDIPDVMGDRELGRQTFPIVFPTMTRPTLAATLGLWSLFGSLIIWKLSLAASTLLLVLGALVAVRFLMLRTTRDDRVSCLLYNIWLSGIHFSLACAADSIQWGVVSYIYPN